jgi:hypothetical protein
VITTPKQYPLEMVATTTGPKMAWVSWTGKVFAVTQEVALGDGAPFSYGWRVTHRPSGHAMGSRHFTEETARKWAEAVDVIPEFAAATYHDMVAKQQDLGLLTRKALRAAGLLEDVGDA